MAKRGKGLGFRVLGFRVLFGGLLLVLGVRVLHSFFFLFFSGGGGGGGVEAKGFQ